MISLGLLWFDDDARRPTARKIADALERYRDRVGFEPTICLVNTAQLDALQAPAALAARPRARRATTAPVVAITLPKTLALTPSTAISPNYFMVGVNAGETPRPVPGRITAEEEYEGRGGRSRAPSAHRSAQATPAPARASAATAAPATRQKRQLPLPPAREPESQGALSTPATRQKRQKQPATPVAAPVATPTPAPARQKRQTKIEKTSTPAALEQRQKRQTEKTSTPAALEQRQKRQAPPRVEAPAAPVPAATPKRRGVRRAPARPPKAIEPTPAAPAGVAARQKRQKRQTRQIAEPPMPAPIAAPARRKRQKRQTEKTSTPAALEQRQERQLPLFPSEREKKSTPRQKRQPSLSPRGGEGQREGPSHRRKTA